MIKNIIIGFLIITLIGSVGYFVYIINFQIFPDHEEIIVKEECDYDGLRKVTMEEIGGNATTNKSIQISATNCTSKNEYSEKILIVSASFIKPSDVSFKWKGFDTLTITFNKNLNVFKQKKESESIKPKITFEYITE